jgi:4-aminobutyrate aminotransferase-like enzyme
MGNPRKKYRPVRLSLSDIVGRSYVSAVCEACAAASGKIAVNLETLAKEKVDFFPQEFQHRALALLSNVGQSIAKPLGRSAGGATSAEFQTNTIIQSAPLAGFALFRVGEDGRLRFTLKSEHYHTPLGHAFPGYRLIEIAKQLNIPNATHNNTRGHITRLLEGALVRVANGLSLRDSDGLERVINSKNSTCLNRVLNLETGSLAVEAALKMILARFYPAQGDSCEAVYKERVPVLLVIGDNEGGIQGNYHGTTVLTQIMRGMWPGFAEGLEKSGILVVRPVRPNKIEDVEMAIAEYEKPPYKIAGLFHEFILMNYGAVRLSKSFVKGTYALCRKHDIPTVADEIQSCLWSPSLFMFREYEVKPTFLAVGKGFPGGEYPASRILFNSKMDSLPQFGALVTNGQEELASLAYHITMRWAEANADITSAIGEYYEERLGSLVKKHSGLMSGLEGRRHLAGLCFNDIREAKEFGHSLVDRGLDISVQTYKDSCPPVALTKLPLTAGYDVVDWIVAQLDKAAQSVK